MEKGIISKKIKQENGARCRNDLSNIEAETKGFTNSFTSMRAIRIIKHGNIDKEAKCVRKKKEREKNNHTTYAV